MQLILQDKEQEAEEELRHIVEQLKNRKIPLEELIIKTQLRKGINDYVATGPHVAAAKRMEEKGVKISPGMLITYYVSEASGNNKKGKARNTRIGDRVKLPDEDGAYDIEYYLHNQILPAVENIFEVLDVSVVDILNGQTQKGLFDFG